MASYVAAAGEFTRDTNYITTRITADGRDGYPVEPDRYRLIVARACPWANRAIIVRRLLGLEGVISIGFCGPTHDERSWTFDLDPGGVDPVLKIPRLQDAYFTRFPDYPKGITVPAIVDVPTGAVVTNDFAQMTLDLSTEWTAYHRDGAPQLYPEPLRGEIDEVSKTGLHRDQQRRVPVRFRRLAAGLRRGLRPVVHRIGLGQRPTGKSALSGRRHHHRGRRPAVHHAGPLRPRLPRPLQMQPTASYPRCRCCGPTRETCSRRPVSATPSTSSRSSSTTTSCTPTSIRPGSCPKGPELANWLTPHGREALGGRPFGDGTPPGPPLDGERVPAGHGV